MGTISEHVYIYIYTYVHESFEHSNQRTRGIKLQMLTSMEASRQSRTGRERNDSTWWPKVGADMNMEFCRLC